MTLELSFVCNTYDWLEPLIAGDVEPDGIDLTVLTGIHSPDRHRRAIRGEYDAAEFSIGSHITGHPDWDFTSIPAFPRRFYPHTRTLVNESAGIESPADFAGRRVGMVSWQNTLALWAKGIYSDVYDLDLHAVEWCVGQNEPVPVELPVDVERIERASVMDQLSAGDLDAIFMPSTAVLYPAPENTRPLFDDVMAVEREYYASTGFCPLMHNVVVKDELLVEEPWVATELLRAFRRSVEQSQQRERNAEKYSLVWWQQYRDREREVFGDLWGRSFEFDANEEELDTMIRFAHEQGLIEERFDAIELFRLDDHTFV